MLYLVISYLLFFVGVLLLVNVFKIIIKSYTGLTFSYQKVLKLTYLLYFFIFGIRSALFLCVLIRLGPDPENSIDGVLPFWEITPWDLMPLGKYPFTYSDGPNPRPIG